ncbi:GNAT family N-acetyltransferase [Aestuariivirga sp. YIM B02566]|uniref:GNAT family N-acetyltransferase n=1 Tax=Taklimakanibacter albus TaxID=2800327 RepID=A0ACC5R1E6_9HYPH|nr:GNAT family N-acetyltransferase [Aestuariivirga sp. YIM B02566]MBK1866286.1 GNAT family N-acetyltransferase [Aestuariivirga sp. YIM B02566]
MKLRLAREGDVPQLLDLEESSFPGDRISERSWRALIGRPSAIVLVAAHRRAVLAAAVLLTRRGTRIARLYSIAVNYAARGAGLGRALMTQLMNTSRQRGYAEMRLESRVDNLAAHRLFQGLGFAEFGAVRKNYYADGTPALRFRKCLRTPNG